MTSYDLHDVSNYQQLSCLVILRWNLRWPVDSYNDDVIKWKHFPCYWPFMRGIRWWPVDSPHKSQWREALMLSQISAWTNGWASNRDAGDLRRLCAHYDVNVMHKVPVIRKSLPCYDVINDAYTHMHQLSSAGNGLIDACIFWRRVIAWTIVDLLSSIGPLETNCCENSIKIYNERYMEIHTEIVPAKYHFTWIHFLKSCFVYDIQISSFILSDSAYRGWSDTLIPGYMTEGSVPVTQ